MDEKDEYPSDIESETESEPENLLALPKKTNFNTINKNHDDDDDDDDDETEESVESEIEEEDDNADEYFDDHVDEVEKIFKSDENTTKTSFNMIDDYENDDDDEDDDENYLQKFNENIKKNVITDYHPELQFHNYEEIENLTTIIRNENGTIVDPLHQTLPFLTKYEKTRILGERTHQINSGAKPFITVEPDIIDGYLIALKELEQKKIPFIVKRPLPNGGCEYWKLKDLEIV
jgi:DNA-directed RNA polymerase I, II, and III subunit RPABC2